MARVRQLVSSAGPGGHLAGDEYDEEDVAAARLVEAGHVEIAGPALGGRVTKAMPNGKPVQTATNQAPERRG